MDWITALCLSVPPSAALVVATCIAGKSLRDAGLTFVRNLNDVAVAVASRAERSVEDAVAALAEAHVAAAKWACGAKRAKLKQDTPEDRTPYAKWLDEGGRLKPQSVIDEVEFAFAYVAGEDSGSEAGEAASPEGAKTILDELAGRGWYAAAMDHAKRRR